MDISIVYFRGIISVHCILYSVTEHDPDLDIITRINVFRETVVTEAELLGLDSRFPFADFGVIYPGQKNACRRFMKRKKAGRYVR